MSEESEEIKLELNFTFSFCCDSCLHTRVIRFCCWADYSIRDYHKYVCCDQCVIELIDMDACPF